MADDTRSVYVGTDTDSTYTDTTIRLNILRQRAAIAEALGQPWIATEPVRAWHAVYYIAALGETRVASILQWRGMTNYKIGVVRDVDSGGTAEFSYQAMTTLAAVVFLGLHYLDRPVEWKQEL